MVTRSRLRGALHDGPQLFGRIEVQSIYHPKTVTQRGSEKPVLVVAPTSVKMRQIELDGAGARSLADDDVELEILHGRIEYLLHDPGSDDGSHR
jgi:hypothetical protein